jgi:hypothetical protein
MSPGRALPPRHRSYWLMRQTKTLPPVPVPFADGSSQVVANPCWEMVLPDVISAFLVWVLGPIPRDVTSVHVPVSSRGATAVAQGGRSLAHPNIPAKQFPRGIQFSRLQSFTHVQAPTLAWPPGCSHRRRKSSWAAGPYTPRRTRLVTCPEQRHRYMPESGNWHGWTLTS